MELTQQGMPNLASINYKEITADGLEQLFSFMEIDPKWEQTAKAFQMRALDNRDLYDAVAGTVNEDMPWWFVAVLHAMESGMNFSTHLHNGDPLTARTVHAPAGRPVEGNPPFKWEYSAIDALRFDGFDNYIGWGLGATLDRIERFNGTGYRKRNTASPYLWSGTQYYKQGKFKEIPKDPNNRRAGYIAVYDPELVSKQVGAAILVRYFTDKTLY